MIPLVQQFKEDIESVVEKYCDQGLTTAEAIGTVELIKLDMYQNALRCNEEDDYE